jgi:hypothetical protein
VLSFLRHGGKEAVITDVDHLPEAIRGDAGTQIVSDPVPIDRYEDVEVFTCR